MPKFGIDLPADRHGVPECADGLSTAGHDLFVAGSDNLPGNRDAMPGISDRMSRREDGLPAAARRDGVHCRPDRPRQRRHDATCAAGAGQTRRDTSAQWADPLAAAGSVASLHLLS
jgi:hypothetical protein